MPVMRKAMPWRSRSSWRAVFEQADESPVDVAEAEEAEVVGVDGVPRTGAKARIISGRERGAEAPLFHGARRRVFHVSYNRRLRTDTLQQWLTAVAATECPPYATYPITVVCSGLIL